MFPSEDDRPMEADTCPQCAGAGEVSWIDATDEVQADRCYECGGVGLSEKRYLARVRAGGSSAIDAAVESVERHYKGRAS